MTVRDLQYAVIRHRRGMMSINTVPLRWWECDVLEVTGSLLWHEFEAKVSRADYTADFRKSTVWRKDGVIVEELKHSVLQDKSGRGPNYFSFVVPAGLLPVEIVPPYAGLYEVNGRFMQMKKKPRRLHDVKIDADRLLNLAWKRRPNYDVNAVYNLERTGAS